jgi:DNA topoisomerase-1
VLYWEWFMEKEALRWLMEFVERSAFGLELWYYPLGNAKAKMDTETAIKQRVGPYRNALLVPVPAEDAGSGKQYGVDHIETGAQGADLMMNIIEKYFGHRRKRYILGQVLTTEAEATGLGGNLASIHLLSYRSIIRYDAKNRDDTNTPFINRLKNWNFPGNGHWTARYVTEWEPVEADTKLNTLKLMQDMGAPISIRQIYKAGGETPPEPGDPIAVPGGMAAQPGPGGPMDEEGAVPEDDDSSVEPEINEEPEEAEAYYSLVDRYAETARYKESEFPSHPTVRQGFTPVVRQAGVHPKTGKRTMLNAFAHPSGATLPVELHARAQKMRLPPAWTEVQINRDSGHPLQAVGKDAKGRQQYRYSAEHTGEQAAKKFRRVKEFVKRLPGLREKIHEHMHGPDGPDRESAHVLHLIDKTGFRIGSDADTKADKKAHGASTLHSSHVRVEGDKSTFHFTGKKGVTIHQEVHDKELADALRPRVKRGGKLFDADQGHIRGFLKRHAGPFKVKDFRTAVAADTALKAMHGHPEPTNEAEFKKARHHVGTIVSKKLGNTPHVALASYIPPEVFAKWQHRSQSSRAGSTPSATTTPATGGKRPRKQTTTS